MRAKQLKNLASNVGKNVYQAGKVVVPAVGNAVGCKASYPVVKFLGAKTLADLGYPFTKASEALETTNEKEKQTNQRPIKEMQHEHNTKNPHNLPVNYNKPNLFPNVQTNIIKDHFDDVNSQYPTMSQLPK